MTVFKDCAYKTIDLNIAGRPINNAVKSVPDLNAASIENQSMNAHVDPGAVCGVLPADPAA